MAPDARRMGLDIAVEIGIDAVNGLSNLFTEPDCLRMCRGLTGGE
jgi:hypothetical protein